MKKYMVCISGILIVLLVTVIGLVKVEQPASTQKPGYVTVAEVESPVRPTITIIRQRGVNFFNGIDFYPAPLPYDSEEGSLALDAMLEIKANFVGLRYYLAEQDLTSNLVVYDIHQDDVLMNIITRIHEAGKGVCLEPQIFLDAPNQFVADLEPSRVKDWFASYTKAVLHYAQFAQDCGVELFSVANENSSLWKYSQDWNKLIDDVSAVYNGNLTVRLNCWWQVASYQAVMGYAWLANSNLDFIGISPYFDLSTATHPGVGDLVKAWTNEDFNRHHIDVAQELENISKKYQKKIVFLEIGYRSINECASEPWNASDVVPKGSGHKVTYSDTDQATAIQALYQVFGGQSWFAGVFWFYWPTAKPANADTTWSLWTKPVEETLGSMFVAH